MPKRIDFVPLGLKNNRLEIIDSQTIVKSGKTYVNCRCECGKEMCVARKDFMTGHTKGCRECYEKSKIKHNLCEHRTYNIWKIMKQRCYNEKDPMYQRYGARGITICDEWRNDFKTFYDWAMVNGYEEHLSIDRINNDGNYEPSNARWATQEQQSCNKSKRDGYSSIYKGVSWAKHSQKWVAMITHQKKQYNLGLYDDEKEAARAYNEAALKYHKEYAYLNIIEDEDSSSA